MKENQKRIFRLGWIISRIRRRFRRKYKVGEHILMLPPDHSLPEYQRAHPLYDRFLPILANSLIEEGIIVDVGANVGDSLYSIIHLCSNKIACIEPSNHFYSYLLKNINNLDDDNKRRIVAHKAMISSAGQTGYLKKTAGTATFIKGINTISTPQISLDSLLSKERIVLIKSDTDGFDFDVLNSASQILSAQEPILYWENLTMTIEQKEGYLSLYRLLEKLDYTILYVFNNYGELIFEETNFETLERINNEILSEYFDNKIPYIHYTDVLACTAKNELVVKSAIHSFKQQYKKNQPVL